MLRIHNIKLNYRHSFSQLQKKAAERLGCRVEDFTSFQVVRQSLDTRKKPDIYYVYSVDVSVPFEQKILKKTHDNQISPVRETPYEFVIAGEKTLEHRPVIVGCGPAGLFCGLELARHGYAPILLERGKPVQERQKDVERFWRDGVLDCNSNVQFGEGGAGTFSDGKLNTLVKDPKGRNHKVLEEFVAFGANEQIRIEAKPHIGTDVLVEILKRMRAEILSLGGTFCFESKVDEICTTDARVCSVKLEDGREIPAQVVILAIGNSARDTFSYLKTTQIQMEAKPFAVGFRVEHPQEMIHEAMYGTADLNGLPTAAYKVTAKAACGKGVYSFCMCPGGYVVNASSEKNRIAVNGMSYHNRDGKNANSAIVMTVGREDFDSDDVLAGMYYQQKLEEAAFAAGNGQVPQQLLKDFKRNRCSTSFGGYVSALKGQGNFGNLRGIFDEKLNGAFLEGMEHFGKIMKGFDSDDVILSGVESRTSSPVKIPRNERFESNVFGVFPCGEGAGYAGGIVSAAMDGLKVAQAVADQYKPRL